MEKSEDAIETDQPSSPGIGTSAEFLEASFKSLAEDYQIRLEELHAAKQGTSTVFGRGFPDESMLKQADKLTAFYTGLSSYTILMCMFKYTTKRLQESTSSGNKLSNFQCFLGTLMKVRLNLSNFDLGFRFCIHVTTVRPQSHYGGNDGEGTVTFYRSHYTFRNANVNVVLT